MAVRAKMKVGSIQKHGERSTQVSLSAVYSDDPHSENKKWADATPSGSLNMTINNPDAANQFVDGKEYYVDISPA